MEPQHNNYSIEWHLKAQKNAHKRHLSDIRKKATANSGNGSFYQQYSLADTGSAKINFKQLQKQEEKKTEIERENVILLQKMHRIFNKKWDANSAQPKSIFSHPGSLNRATRFNALTRIDNENRNLLSRIRSQKSHYTHNVLQSHSHQDERLVRNISRYRKKRKGVQRGTSAQNNEPRWKIYGFPDEDFEYNSEKQAMRASRKLHNFSMQDNAALARLNLTTAADTTLQEAEENEDGEQDQDQNQIAEEIIAEMDTENNLQEEGGTQQGRHELSGLKQFKNFKKLVKQNEAFKNQSSKQSVIDLRPDQLQEKVCIYKKTHVILNQFYLIEISKTQKNYLIIAYELNSDQWLKLVLDEKQGETILKHFKYDLSRFAQQLRISEKGHLYLQLRKGEPKIRKLLSNDTQAFVQAPLRNAVIFNKTRRSNSNIIVNRPQEMQRPRTVHLRTESSKDIGNFYTSSAATRPQKKRQRPMTAGVLKGKASEKSLFSNSEIEESISNLPQYDLPRIEEIRESSTFDLLQQQQQQQQQHHLQQRRYNQLTSGSGRAVIAANGFEQQTTGVPSSYVRVDEMLKFSQNAQLNAASAIGEVDDLNYSQATLTATAQHNNSSSTQKKRFYHSKNYQEESALRTSFHLTPTSYEKNSPYQKLLAQSIVGEGDDGTGNTFWSPASLAAQVQKVKKSKNLSTRKQNQQASSDDLFIFA